MAGGNQCGMYTNLVKILKGTHGCYVIGWGMFDDVYITVPICSSEQ